MGRSGKRNTDSGLRPVTRLELSDNNRMLRIILLVVFLVIAIVAFVIGIRAVLNVEPGWTQVKSAAMERHCGDDFILNYCYGQTDENPAAEQKRLETLYSKATVDAYNIFHEGLIPVCAAVNQPVTVDPALYAALQMIQRHGNRALYLGPVYTEYNRIFTSETESVAADNDPGQNPELLPYIQQLVAFANDPAMIDLQLLENNQVQLTVDEVYLTFAKEYEITEFVEFGWMRNAFIADYLAQRLLQEGFTNGVLSSHDGFTRNLDPRGESFTQNIFHREGSEIYMPAVLEYSQPMTIVILRDYPMSQRDQYHYYPFTNGRIVTAFLDPADGMSKCATDTLVSCSADMSCAQMLLRLMPIYLADSLNTAALENLLDAGISSMWFEDTVLYCNDSSLQLRLTEEMEADYTIAFTQ